MQVATALRDRAQRIYEKYGNVMLDVAGMTKAGIERKATCRALFSKLLYLAGAHCPAWSYCLDMIPFLVVLLPAPALQAGADRQPLPYLDLPPILGIIVEPNL